MVMMITMLVVRVSGGFDDNAITVRVGGGFNLSRDSEWWF